MKYTFLFLLFSFLLIAAVYMYLNKITELNLNVYEAIYSYLTCTECPINAGPQDISVVWQNTEKYKEGNVGKYVSAILSDGILYSERAATGIHLYTPIVKFMAMLPR
jgi:hypothetical protein